MANFVFSQYGGSSGGSAGDACLIQLGDANLVVDFGLNTQRDWLLGDLGRSKYSAVVTHFHTDHCGTSVLRRGAEQLFVNKTSLMQAHADTLEYDNCETADNDDEIWQHTDGKLDVCVWFIAGPGTEDHGQGENAHSAGVYGRVSCDDTVVFRWLLLGDMVPEAWANVVAVLPDGAMLNYVKLPHHGSPSNHMADLFKNHVDTNTILVSSGYNNLDSAWDKIKLANNALNINQVRVLTHHYAGQPGMKWADYQRKWLELTINQEGAWGWRKGDPDRNPYL